MTLVLDTSILIELEKKNSFVIDKLRSFISLNPSPAKITFMNYFEFLFGLHQKSPKNKDKAIAFLNHFSVLQTTKSTAEILSDLKYKYDKKGIVLALSDLLIASLVMENNMTLISMDKDFEKIVELKKIII